MILRHLFNLLAFRAGPCAVEGGICTVAPKIDFIYYIYNMETVNYTNLSPERQVFNVAIFWIFFGDFWPIWIKMAMGKVDL